MGIEAGPESIKFGKEGKIYDQTTGKFDPAAAAKEYDQLRHLMPRAAGRCHATLAAPAIRRPSPSRASRRRANIPGSATSRRGGVYGCSSTCPYDSQRTLRR